MPVSMLTTIPRSALYASAPLHFVGEQGVTRGAVVGALARKAQVVQAGKCRVHAALRGGRSLLVGRLLGPTRRRILKILLPSIGCLVEEGIGVCQAPGAARIDRIGVEDLAVDGKEDAKAMLLTLRAIGVFRASISALGR